MKVADMHCDTIGVIYEKNLNGDICNLKNNNLHLDINKLKLGNYILQNFAMFIDIAKYKMPYKTLLDMIDYYYKEIEANNNDIKMAFSYKDILENIKENKISAILTIEDGGALEGDLENLKTVYNKGVRLITLTWNFENGIGYPNLKVEVDNNGKYTKQPDLSAINIKDGLTPFGIEFIKAMEELGVIVDVSHLSDKGFYDVLKNTKKPFVASHSNARNITNIARNMNDDMIKKLSDRGGLIGVNFCSDFIQKTPYYKDTFSTIDDIIAHIKHIKKIGGIDCIALGSDFDGIPSTLEIKDGSYMPKLSEKLLKSGFTEKEVEKIFFKNILRLYKELL